MNIAQAHEPVLIGVMGATGTGKSTFINLASDGRHCVGNGLASCTSEVEVSKPFQIDGRKVVLIDTPGFDDTNLSDTDILKKISLHLEQSYRSDVTLHGMLYLHRISDVRIGGISRRNFRMFRKICGDDTLKNVLIVTTMWGLVSSNVAGARESELQSDPRFFKPVLDHGAVMVRHDNTRQTAHAILRQVLYNRPLPLEIQREMVDEGKDISETAAAAEIDRELAGMIERHKREIEQVRKELQEAMDAKDEQARRELLEVKEDLEAKVRQAQYDRQRLSEEYAAEKQRADEVYAKMLKEMEEQRVAIANGDERLDAIRQHLHESNMQASKEREMLLQQMMAQGERVVYVERGPCLVQ